MFPSKKFKRNSNLVILTLLCKTLLPCAPVLILYPLQQLETGKGPHKVPTAEAAAKFSLQNSWHSIHCLCVLSCGVVQLDVFFCVCVSICFVCVCLCACLYVCGVADACSLMTFFNPEHLRGKHKQANPGWATRKFTSHTSRFSAILRRAQYLTFL